MPELVMVLRGREPDQEAEPVTVETFGQVAILTLDDGEEITIDSVELIRAIERANAAERRAA